MGVRERKEGGMAKTKDDLGLVLRAVQFAAHKHKDQRRKDAKATPYINHPIALAEVLHTDGRVRVLAAIAAALRWMRRSLGFRGARLRMVNARQ